MVQRGAITLIALCTLAACSQADASGDMEKESKPKVTTTTAPSTTTTTTPPPYSFDGSVPAPPLVNTGTDYEAIFRSLSAYGRWLVRTQSGSSVAFRGVVEERLSSIVTSSDIAIATVQ